ncbi:MAG: PHP domain protein [Dehalococcoides mccartyi]|uniref:PHP domain-containing protein n=1 Tax=Dehalococcoides mccartyi TaxID=61435 RepID=UPI00242EFAB6|nr:PHP domain-containing protein [Dehalococcoides mccartyi]MCF7634898.1 PHP domain protein [Dehalococcoides mccartyi]MEA2121852.1 hypothetical protein [Dehalococcoides mccartyi]MEA2122939.1 hypothetical protein [Dehalococcoides mccartyi]
MLKADLHVHTNYSMDSNTKPEDLIKRCVEKGINCISVCDHGTAEGALMLAKNSPIKIIVSEEVLTPHGEIMGMFLKESIPSGISVDECVSRIKAQGALVCIPHPYDKLRGSALIDSELERLASEGKIDVLEVFNSRTLLNGSLKKARKLAKQYDLPTSAGTDSHTLPEIGTTYVTMPDFNTPKEFIAALRQGRITGRQNRMVRIRALIRKLSKYIKPEK